MRNLIFTIVITLSCATFAQTTYKGIVRDSYNQPISYANVIAQTNDGTLITGVITDEQGKFELLINRKGPFNISVSFIGYKTWIKEVINNENTELGLIKLSKNLNELNEVVLVGEKPIITKKADRLVFNVQNSVVSKGYDALETLKSVPRIDPTTEQLKMIGKSSVIVLVNDRQINLDGSDLSTYLKSIRSDNIARIEVLTTPPAKYDAAANSGLINIVLKKNENLGFDGTITSTFIQRTRPGLMPSTSLRYSSKRLTTSLNIFADQEMKKYDTDVNIDYTSSIRKSTVKREDDIKGIASGLTVDYQLSDRVHTGIVLNGSYWDTDQATQSNVLFISLPEVIDSTQNLPSNNTNKYDYSAFSAYYDIMLDTLGRTLKFNYNNLKKSNEDSRRLTSKSYNGNFESQTDETSASNIGHSDYSATSINTDFELPFENFKLELGGKWTKLSNNSEIQFFNTTSSIPVLNNNNSNTFNYDETIWAGYISLEKSWNDGLYSKAGIRYESTSTKGYSSDQDSSFTNSFSNFFPSVIISYAPNESNSFSLAYNKRIDRPIFYDVNPFRTYIDLYNYVEGNPYLQPSLTKNIEFSYTYKNNLSMVAYASFLKDGSEYITITSNEDLYIVSRPENYYNQSTYGLDISYSLKLFNNFSSNNSFSMYYNSAKSKLSQFTASDLGGSGYFISTNNTWTFNEEKKNRLYLKYYHKFPSTEGLTTIYNRANLKLGCLLNFLDNRLTLNIFWSDIFKQSFTKTKEEYSGFIMRAKQYGDQQNFNITATYKFGNKKSKNIKRAIDDSDKSRFYE